MRTLLISIIVAIGLGLMIAPTANAQAVPDFQPCSDQFLNITDPGALTSDKSVVISPFGTANIWCRGWHGFFDAYQVDPNGHEHGLLHLDYMYPLSRFYFYNPFA